MLALLANRCERPVFCSDEMWIKIAILILNQRNFPFVVHHFLSWKHRPIKNRFNSKLRVFGITRLFFGYFIASFYFSIDCKQLKKRINNLNSIHWNNRWKIFIETIFGLLWCNSIVLSDIPFGICQWALLTLNSTVIVPCHIYLRNQFWMYINEVLQWIWFFVNTFITLMPSIMLIGRHIVINAHWQPSTKPVAQFLKWRIRFQRHKHINRNSYIYKSFDLATVERSSNVVYWAHKRNPQTPITNNCIKHAKQVLRAEYKTAKNVSS